MKVGVLGGGQLGRMLGLAGIPLGMRFQYFEQTTQCPSDAVGALHLTDFNKPESLLPKLPGLDVVTCEFENIPADLIKALSKHVPCYPDHESFSKLQDRLVEKQFLNAHGVKTAAFVDVESKEDLLAGVKTLGTPCILKTRRFGYDGKGQRFIAQESDLSECYQLLAHGPCILEQVVAFRREVSCLAVRGINGEMAFYPLAENTHRNGILVQSRPVTPITPTTSKPPESASLQEQANEIARKLMEALRYVGVMAIEFFEVDGVLIANEVAPRVHNSGHWTIEGCVTSQFENHMRAVAGLPLGDTGLVYQHIAMFNLIGKTPGIKSVTQIPGVHLHLYDKTDRPGRKIGHITVATHQKSAFDESLKTLADTLSVTPSA